MPKKHSKFSIQNSPFKSSSAEYLTFIASAGESAVEMRYEDENIWLTQKLMAELYGKQEEPKGEILSIGDLMKMADEEEDEDEDDDDWDDEDDEDMEPTDGEPSEGADSEATDSNPSEPEAAAGTDTTPSTDPPGASPPTEAAPNTE